MVKDMISKLTKRHILKNKKRTLVTVIAITLTSMLLFSLGFAYGTFRENQIVATKRGQGDHDARINKIEYQKHDILDSDSRILKYSYVSYLYETDIQYGVGGDTTFVSPLTIFNVSDSYNLDIKKGRRPKNESELMLTLYVMKDLGLEVGDEYTFNTTDYNGNIGSKTYKIVGVYDDQTSKLVFSNDDVRKTIIYVGITNGKVKNDSETYFYFYLKNKLKAYDQLFSISENLGLEKTYIRGTGDSYIGLEAHDQLLGLYGSYRNPVTYAMVYVTLIILLAILSIACTAIVYNSFAISLTERKKQFGILKSVGATNSQVKRLVFKEAIYVSLIAIPLGFVLSYIGVGAVINLINEMTKYTNNQYNLAIYSSYLMICLLFIILTIFYSALFPANRASEITPIEAIRQNKDIKTRHKNKKHPWIQKIFGVSGIIAFNSIKRNKKKYRITTFAITISVLLFITVSTFINLFQITNDYGDSIKTGAQVSIYSEDIKDIALFEKDMNTLVNVKEMVSYKYKWIMLNPEIDLNIISQEYKKEWPEEQSLNIISMIALEKEELEHIRKKYNINGDNPIFVNYFKNQKYDDQGYLVSTKFGNIVKKDAKLETKLCGFTYNNDGAGSLNECTEELEFNLINEKLYKKDLYELYQTVLVNEDIFNKLTNSLGEEYTLTYHITSDDYFKLDDEINDIVVSNNGAFSYMNYSKENYNQISTFNAIKLVVYSAIFLFATIAITSIVNTISANMNLRKSEFAVLKSIGLSNKQFDKMLVIEGFFLSIKSLIYAIPLSMLVILGVSRLYSINDQKYTFGYIFPTKYFILALILVFVVIITTIILTTRHNKKENIIESIREENV